MMKAQTYLAVLEPCATGYGVYFPDFPGCVASGKSVEQAARMAKEALAMHYYSMEQDGEVLPQPSQFLEKEDTEGNIIVPVTIYPELQAEEFKNRRVKTNTTIPAWLKAAAEEKQINFSRVLENALLQMIH